MPVRVKVSSSKDVNVDSGWPLKPSSFLFSVLTHSLLAALLVHLPGTALFSDQTGKLRKEDFVIVIPKAKIYWVPLNRSIPRLAPSETTPVDDSAAGRVRRPTESVVVKQPDATNRKQLVWQPDAPNRLEAETPLPDMVAVKGKPSPKPFIPPPPKSLPPPQSPEIAQPEAIPTQPSLPQSAVALAPLPTAKPKPKSFVPPKERPQLPLAPGTIAEAPPAITETASRNLNTPAAQGLSSLPSAKPPPRSFVPPPSRTAGSGSQSTNGNAIDTAPQITPGGTGAAMTAVVIGINPSAINVALPKGSQPAEFSTGPRRGAPAASPATGLVVPGVAAQGRESKPSGINPPAPDPSAPRFEMRLPPSASSMSAPLRPGSRTVPRSIEERFANRILYAIVIPKPKLAVYNGDWTIWFGERTPSAVNTAQMRAPVPIRKFLNSPAQAGLPSPPGATEGFVQVTAIIGADGKLRNIQPILGRFPQLAENAAVDLAAWEFRPATLNGIAADVDVVIELFFRSN